MRYYIILFLLTQFPGPVCAQDSVKIRIHPSYNERGKFHRWLFGENYRKEWSTEITLPLVHISTFHGGLKPTELGGGMQSRSLRLEDKNGKEWVIRSVEKNPEAVIPEALRKTFARDWIDDATSAQYPFGALVVPALANAAGIPHSTPLIAVIAPDKALGEYAPSFTNMIALIEEREPLGKSDNTAKMKKNLAEDNDNKINGRLMLRARLLDMLVGDWDRHEDQWRWYDEARGKSKEYLPVPRDRDQVFHLTEGIVPKMASREYIVPYLRSFDRKIRHAEWVSYKTRFVNAYPSFQFSREEWIAETRSFQQAITDSILEAALQAIPAAALALRKEELLDKLKQRRANLLPAMTRYYNFIQKISDIELTDKNELVELTDATNGDVQLKIRKISKEGDSEDQLAKKTFDAKLTKELRIYLRDGKDSVYINTPLSRISYRFISGKDKKSFVLPSTGKKFRNYRSDSAFTPVNLYNTLMPLAWFGINLDDGLLIGAGFKYTKQEGFQKSPYAAMHQLTAGYSFSTGAFRIKYNAEWIHAFRNTDVILQALAKAPNNTINFFGLGNESEFDKTGDFKRFYRTRFSTYQLDPAFRWRNGDRSISIGPSLYYYGFDDDENIGRFITNPGKIGSYDSLVIAQHKTHIGGIVQYTIDTRNARIIPQQGMFINLKAQAYKAANQYARDFIQFVPELAFYQKLDPNGSFILAERIGATLTAGNPAFYQSAFIGGHENLLGYRQYRFAGQHSVYNNLELRLKLADVASYILPGQFGVTGFWDVGRVWEKHDKSGKLHHGIGGGIYFAPASLFAFNLVMGYSREGLLPYFTMGFRF